MNNDDSANPALVELTMSDGQLSAPVLERLISAAATRADLSIDRIVNALAAVDALVHATEQVYATGDERKFSISIAPGEIRLAVDGLRSAQAESLLGATRLPEIGGVLEHMASSVATEQNGEGTSLVLAFT
jgi:hypothetical protein